MQPVLSHLAQFEVEHARILRFRRGGKEAKENYRYKFLLNYNSQQHIVRGLMGSLIKGLIWESQRDYGK